MVVLYRFDCIDKTKRFKKFTTKILSEVYNNTEIEPNSTLLAGKEFTRTANSKNKARPTTEHVGFGKEANKHLKKGPPSA